MYPANKDAFPLKYYQTYASTRWQEVEQDDYPLLVPRPVGSNLSLESIITLQMHISKCSLNVCLSTASYICRGIRDLYILS